MMSLLKKKQTKTVLLIGLIVIFNFLLVWRISGLAYTSFHWQNFVNIYSNGPKTPQLASPNISGDDVQLQWVAEPDNTLYEVWRSQTPYFAPFDANTTLLDSTSTNSYVDENILNGSNENYFYRAIGIASNSQRSEASNEVGVFQFTVTPGD